MNRGVKFNQVALTVFSRGKKTRGAASAGTKRIVTQLSVLSASKKQPRLLKLSNSDIVRHQTVSNAWSVYQRQLRELLAEKLRKQHQALVASLDDLKQHHPQLYQATKYEKGQRGSLELRAPAEYPADEVWNKNYRASD